MRSKYVQYYVEGQDEKKLIDVLKTDLRLIKPGKVQILNVMEEEISDFRLGTLSRGTMVVLVFDTDTGTVDTLKRNIKKLELCPSVSEIVLIPQVPNLEGELLRSCNIKKIGELLNSPSVTDFKRDLIKVSNLGRKLKEHQFDIGRLWSKNPGTPYQEIKNQSERIKKDK